MHSTHSRYTLFLSCAIFLFFGVVTAGLGPVLPQLAENTSATLTDVGGVFSATFLGALISQLVFGPLNDRFGQKSLMLISTLFLAAGIFGVTVSTSLWMLLAVSFLAGLGHGTVDLSTSVLISRTFPQRNTSMMNLLHFFFGLGAFIGPALISLAIRLGAKGTLVLLIGSGCILILTLFIPRIHVPPLSPAEKEEQNQNSSLYHSPVLWLSGCILLLYVGAENGMGGWTTTYMHTSAGMDLQTAALVTSGFWGALTIGRLVTALVSRHLGPPQILTIAFSACMLSGVLFALSTGHRTLSIIAIVLIGFFAGAIYPTVISLLTTHFNHAAGKAASVGAAMGSIGGMILPWEQGYLLENVNPSASAWFAAGALFVMFLLLQALRQQFKKETL